MMPSYVNIGARVGANTMVDTWATVGSCAQIGANAHLSGGVGIGGVLEPPQAAPVIVDDDALIGSRCMVTQGARVGHGAVLGEGCILNRGIPVIDAETGEELSRGVVPAWSVGLQAHPAPRLSRAATFGLPCVLIVRRLEEGQRPRQGPAQRHPARARRHHLMAGDDRPAGRAPPSLVDIPSVSHHEAGHGRPRGGSGCARCRGCRVDRVGDNVVARTELGRPSAARPGRPPRHRPGQRQRPRPASTATTLWGLGSADMKGGLAVMLELAATVAAPAVDVTFVFYAAEEVARDHNGLLAVAAARPDLLAGDAAILGEPTGAPIEAGCQGVLKVAVTLGGRPGPHGPAVDGRQRHPPARPAARRGGGLTRRGSPMIDGCRYREALQAVRVDGGVAGQRGSRPGHASSSTTASPPTGTPARRRSRPERAPGAAASIREPGTGLEVVDVSPAAAARARPPPPGRLLEATGAPARAKLGWTDVAFFAERGIPAANFGPGDPELAHTAGERVDSPELDAALAALVRVVTA